MTTGLKLGLPAGEIEDRVGEKDASRDNGLETVFITSSGYLPVPGEKDASRDNGLETTSGSLRMASVFGVKRMLPVTTGLKRSSRLWVRHRDREQDASRDNGLET